MLVLKVIFDSLSLHTERRLMFYQYLFIRFVPYVMITLISIDLLEVL